VQRALHDHAAIANLADELLPALIARLGDSGLGEIEVRQGEWKARLRQPAGAGAARGRQGASRSSPGRSDGPAAGPRAPDRSPARAESRPAAADSEPEAKRAVATSPAVGIYHPRKELTVGMRVAAGDKIGTVDVLGVRQDVVAPVAGVIGSSLAEAGEAVEYGQELVLIELLAIGLDLAATAGDPEIAGVMGED
jgi:biotin carboxyl carrier protein